MEQSLPKTVFSKISLFIDEQPFDHAVTDLLKGGQDSYTVTLSCEYPNPVTVSISPSSTRLNVTPATLQFNNTNWNTPQTVEVNSVGRIIKADNTTLQSFTLSHVAATTDAEDQAVQTTADLIVNLRPATDSFLDQLTSEFGDILLDEMQDQVTETILEESGERVKNKILKKALKSLSKALPYAQAIESAATILDRLKTVKGLYLSAGEQFHSLSRTLFRNHEALQDGSFSWHSSLTSASPSPSPSPPKIRRKTPLPPHRSMPSSPAVSSFPASRTRTMRLTLTAPPPICSVWTSFPILMSHSSPAFASPSATPTPTSMTATSQQKAPMTSNSSPPTPT